MLDFSLIYVPFFVISGVISLLISWVMFRQKNVSGSSFLAIVFFFLGMWTILAALEASSGNLQTKIILSKIQYFPIQNMTPFLVMFVLSYSGRISPPYPRKYLLLWVVPVIIISLALTNELHGLIWSGFSAIDPQTKLMVYYQGGAYWIMEAYYIVLLAAMMILLAVEMVKSPHARYRWQIGLMMLAILGPSIGGIIYVSNFNPMPGLDWGSVGVTFTALIMSTSLFGFRFLNIVPIAREMLLEQMEVGVIVIDSNRRVIDLNPALGYFFPNHNLRLGSPAEKAFKLMGLNEITPQRVGYPIHQEIILNHERWYCLDFKLTELFSNNRFVGWLGELRDISFQKKAVQEKETINQQLQTQIHEIQILQQELREQAIRDPLTNLFNRRFFDESFTLELAGARRSGRSICLLLIDIDHFKDVNDQFGHLSGDRVLRNFGRLMVEKTRKSDVVCRYGGEEFIILMNDMKIEEACERAEILRKAFEEMCLQDQSIRKSVTISAGISEFPLHGDEENTLIGKADDALYAAKQAGRNCVRLAKIRSEDKLTAAAEGTLRARADSG